MKKYFILIVTIVAVIACSKNTINDSPVNQNEFKAGQKVTLCVSAGDETKVSSSIDNEGYISFKWQANDKISVKVGEETRVFDLKSEPGSSKAFFEGEMPGTGSNFSIQYPAVLPNMEEQNYVENGIPDGSVVFYKDNCTIGGNLDLDFRDAIVCLKFKGTEKVGQIDFTKKAATKAGEETEETYSLLCNGAQLSDNATNFYIFVPKGTYKLKVVVKDEQGGVIDTLEPENEVDLSQGLSFSETIVEKEPIYYIEKTVNYGTGTKLGNLWWAPVNCGYDAEHKYGLLYQWGRIDGGGYTGETLIQTATSSYGTTDNPQSDTFYKTSGGADWYSGTNPSQSQLWSNKSKTKYDPCPDGWRIPTITEWRTIWPKGDNYKGSSSNRANAIVPTEGYEKGTKGLFFSNISPYDEKNPKLYLPATGSRGYAGGFSYREARGYYWSTDIYIVKSKPNRASYQIGGADNTDTSTGGGFAEAFAIRCVHD